MPTTRYYGLAAYQGTFIPEAYCSRSLLEASSVAHGCLVTTAHGQLQRTFGVRHTVLLTLVSVAAACMEELRFYGGGSGRTIASSQLQQTTLEPIHETRINSQKLRPGLWKGNNST